MAENTYDLDFTSASHLLCSEDIGDYTQAENYMNYSDEIFEMFCETCMRDGLHEKAHAFCTSCIAYYCAACLKQHGRFFRKHKYLQGDEMYVDICQEKCNTHTNEIIKFYCCTCRQFVCTICKEDLHTDECSIKYLPDLLKDKDFENELKQLHLRHETLIEKVFSTQEIFANKYQHFSNVSQESRHAIKQEKDNIFGLFDKEADEIETIVYSRKKRDCTVVDSLKERNESLALEIKKLSRNIAQLTTSGNGKYKVFIDLQKVSERIKLEEDSIDMLRTSFSDPDIENRAKKLTNEVKAFGTILRQSIQSESINELEIKPGKNALALDDINVKADGDEEICNIIDCCMISEKNLVLCDKSNSSLKLFDTILDKIVQVISVDLAPESVTTIDKHQIAFVHATGEDEDGSKICFLTLTDINELRLQKRFILTEMHCYTVAFWKEDKLILSMFQNNEGKVQIINMAGNVLANIKTDIDGAHIFKNPYCLTINAEKTYAYVSDWYRDEIIEIDLDSNKTREVAYMWHPEGITMDEDGFVYVIEFGSAKIFYFHPHRDDCKKMALLKTNNWKPFGICYSYAEKKLYVSEEEHDMMKVFKITDNVPKLN